MRWPVGRRSAPRTRRSSGEERSDPEKAKREPSKETTIARRKKALPSPKGLLELVEGSLSEDKAEAVVVIGLDGKSSIADYMVVANGRSQRHVAAVAEHLTERLKAAGISPVPIEGQSQGDWVLIDAGDVIVHLFRPEVREFYNLEKMWGHAMPEDLGPDAIPHDAIGPNRNGSAELIA